MCLAVPGKILSVELDAQGTRMGAVSFGGIKRRVCLAYVPEAVVGDYVLVHVGFALGKVDEREAQETLATLREMDELSELDIAPPG